MREKYGPVALVTDGGDIDEKKVTALTAQRIGIPAARPDVRCRLSTVTLRFIFGGGNINLRHFDM